MSTVPTFQGGKRKHVVVAATAGNVVSNSSPGSGKRWKILSCKVILVTDVNAGNRYVIFQLTDGTNIYSMLGRGAVQTQSATAGVQIDRVTPTVVGGVVIQDLDVNGITTSRLPLPENILEGDDQFRITISGGLAGDSFTARLVVMELPIGAS